MLRTSSCLFRPLVASSSICLRLQSLSIRSMATNAPKFWFVQYDYIPDILEKRGPHRASHLKYASKFRDNGTLIIGGAFNPPEAAGLVFKIADKSEVEKFCKEDPYVINGLVTNFTIREWNVVISSIDDSNLKL